MTANPSPSPTDFGEPRPTDPMRRILLFFFLVWCCGSDDDWLWNCYEVCCCGSDVDDVCCCGSDVDDVGLMLMRVVENPCQNIHEFFIFLVLKTQENK